MRRVPGQYDQAQICQNGHVINSSIQTTPEDTKKFCDRCGAETLSQCPSCNTPIQGMYFGSGFAPYVAPSYCHQCGAAFPWLASRLEAAQAIAATVPSLDATDCAAIDASIRDMVGDTPKATTAALKFKGLMVKAGREAAGMFQKVVTDVLSETAKKILLP